MKFNFYPCFNHLSKYNNVLLYSDPHFGDAEMIEKRGVSDEEQIKNINSVVGKKDVLIIMGDVGDGDPEHLDYALSCIKKLRGYKILIMGNHDLGKTNYERHTYVIKDYLGRDITVDNHLFDEVYEGVVTLNEKIILSHEPLNIDLLPFLFNIHGHDHSGIENNNIYKNHLNVCAESINYIPVSLSALVKKGLFSNIGNVHRVAIDKAIDRKAKREHTKFGHKGRNNLIGE